MKFLESLSPAERQAFISVAQVRTFVRGARIIQEGAPADYVIVVQRGWTKITVDDNGSERIIAERGPGQLIGERGALQVNVRSANVVALGTVRALVMRTEDFASFIDAHPRVLEVIEEQIYDRLVEESPRSQRVISSLGPADLPPRSPRRSPAKDSRRVLVGENCTVLLTDVVEFGAHFRNDQDRQIIRLSSEKMIRMSLGRVWSESICEDRGDGLRVVVPPHIPTVHVMTLLHRGLPGELRRHNRTYSDAAHIGLRVAVNVGPVATDAVGVNGEAIIRAARLIEAPVLKEAMTETGATLGIIVSEFVYETAIRHTPESIDIHGYKPVEVDVKETRVPAWMQVIDLSPSSAQLHAPLRVQIGRSSVAGAGASSASRI